MKMQFKSVLAYARKIWQNDGKRMGYSMRECVIMARDGIEDEGRNG